MIDLLFIILSLNQEIPFRPVQTKSQVDFGVSMWVRVRKLIFGGFTGFLCSHNERYPFLKTFYHVNKNKNFTKKVMIQVKVYV